MKDDNSIREWIKAKPKIAFNERSSSTKTNNYFPRMVNISIPFKIEKEEINSYN